MKIPQNTNLPFFAYGLFKPGQLCYFRIKDYVKKSIYGEVRGTLKERDGIPLLVKSDDSIVKGFLIEFNADSIKNAYDQILLIEPEEVYTWDIILVNGSTKANVLLGRRIDRGVSDLEHFTEWDGSQDPYFKDALKEINKIIRENGKLNMDDYIPLFRLQMAYNLLWTIIERYAGLRYNLGKDVVKKVNNIGTDSVFTQGLKTHVKRVAEIYSTSDLSKYTLNSEDPAGSLKYYYQVRSNSIHRGKAVSRDFSIVKDSLEELNNIFNDMLKDTWGKGKIDNI